MQLLIMGILTELSEESSPFPFCPHCPRCSSCLLSQAQPLPRCFQRAKLVPCCQLSGCQPDEVQTCDLLSPGGLPRVESEMWWSTSFTSSAFSRKWSTLGPEFPFVFVCGYVGESMGSIQPIKVTCRRGSAHSLVSAPKLCSLTTQLRCLWRFLSEGWKFASVLLVQVLSQIWTKSL